MSQLVCGQVAARRQSNDMLLRFSTSSNVGVQVGADTLVVTRFALTIGCTVYQDIDQDSIKIA